MAELFFGEYRLDTRGLTLEGPEGATELRAKTLDTLLYLISNRNRYVPRQELLEQIWSDVQVTGASVTQCISELRQALADDPKKPRFIETRVKYGYRFVAPLFHRPTERLEPLPPPPGPHARGAEPTGRAMWLVPMGLVAALVVAIGVAAVVRAVRAEPPTFVVRSLVEDDAPGSEALAETIEAGIRARLEPSLAPRSAASHRIELRCRSVHGLRRELTITITQQRGDVQIWGWTWVVASDDDAAATTAGSVVSSVLEVLAERGLLTVPLHE